MMTLADKVKAAQQIAQIATGAAQVYTLGDEIQPPPVPSGLEGEAAQTQQRVKAAFEECGNHILQAAAKAIDLVVNGLPEVPPLPPPPPGVLETTANGG